MVWERNEILPTYLLGPRQYICSHGITILEPRLESCVERKVLKTPVGIGTHWFVYLLNQKVLSLLFARLWASHRPIRYNRSRDATSKGLPVELGRQAHTPILGVHSGNPPYQPWRHRTVQASRSLQFAWSCRKSHGEEMVSLWALKGGSERRRRAF